MKYWKLFFALWIFFWIFYLGRGFYKGELNEWKALLSRDREARRAYILSQGLYDFIQYAMKNMPENGTYRIEGNIEPLARYRLAYYLYPRKESAGGAYIVTFKENRYNLSKR